MYKIKTYVPEKNTSVSKDIKDDLPYIFPEITIKKKQLVRCYDNTQTTTNYVLPRDSVRSFKGPYILIENIVQNKDVKNNIKINNITCYPDYIFINSRIWDLKLPGGKGLFETNLNTMEYGPNDKSSSFISMCKKNVNSAILNYKGTSGKGITFGSHTSSLQKKNEDYVVENFKDKGVLKPIVHFLTARSAIPFRSILKVKKKIGEYEQKFLIDVAKYDNSEDVVKKNVTSSMYLKIGAATSDNEFFSAYALSSSCLNLLFDIGTKIMKIEYLQTVPSFFLQKERGYIKNFVGKLPCVNNVTKENKQEYTFSYKDWLEIVLQLSIHLGSVFAITLDDYMFVTLRKQKLVLSRVGLGTVGLTKYGEVLSNLYPAFKQQKLYMHPIAYDLYSKSLHSKVLSECLEDNAEILKNKIFEELQTSESEKKKIKKVKHLINFLIQPSIQENIENLINYFTANNEFDFLWKKNNGKKYIEEKELFLSNLIWYFIKSDKRPNLGFDTEKLETMRDEINADLILNNRNDDFFNFATIIEKSLDAMKQFDPYRESFFTNNFNTIASNLEITLWK